MNPEERRLKIHAGYLRGRLQGEARRIANLMSDADLCAKEREHHERVISAVVSKTISKNEKRHG